MRINLLSKAFSVICKHLSILQKYDIFINQELDNDMWGQKMLHWKLYIITKFRCVYQVGHFSSLAQSLMQNPTSRCCKHCCFTNRRRALLGIAYRVWGSQPEHHVPQPAEGVARILPMEGAHFSKKSTFLYIYTPLRMHIFKKVHIPPKNLKKGTYTPIFFQKPTNFLVFVYWESSGGGARLSHLRYPCLRYWICGHRVQRPIRKARGSSSAHPRVNCFKTFAPPPWVLNTGRRSLQTGFWEDRWVTHFS